jgi:hypothetical protein
MVKTFKATFNPKGVVIQNGKIRVKARARNVYEISCMDADTKELVYWRFVWGLNELHFQIRQIAETKYADQIFEYFASKQVLELNPTK